MPPSTPGGCAATALKEVLEPQKSKNLIAKLSWHRRVLKWGLILVGVFVVLVGLVLLLIDPVSKMLAEKRLTSITGREVTIEDLDVGIFRSEITIAGLKIFHPPEYGGGVLLVFPELHIGYDWEALRKRKVLHLEEVRLHVGRVNLVADAKGETFFNRYKKSVSHRKKLAPTTKGTTSSRKKKKRRQSFVGIDELKLTLGRLRVTDMRRPGWAEEYGVNIRNAVFRDLHTREDFETMFLQLIAVMGFYTGFEKVLEGWDQMEERTPSKSEP